MLKFQKFQILSPHKHIKKETLFWQRILGKVVKKSQISALR